jgi:hypothetical protein
MAAIITSHGKARHDQFPFVSLCVQRLEEEIRKNWRLIVVLIACNLISMIPAYFLSGWASVAATLFFIIVSTVLGYYAITRVITITKETR